MRLLLASHSPRRRELIGQLGMEVRIVEVEVDEQVSPTWDASQVAERLACRKAEVYDTTHLAEDEVLVTADTVVVLDGHVLGKPSSPAEASAMLHALSGRAHTVYTGVCLRSPTTQRSFTEATSVHFRPLTHEMIDYYIRQFRPFDKAGSYGIQEWIGMVGIERIEGCYYNVMGLPLSRLYAELQNMVGRLDCTI